MCSLRREVFVGCHGADIYGWGNWFLGFLWQGVGRLKGWKMWVWKRGMDEADVELEKDWLLVCVCHVLLVDKEFMQ